MKLPEKQPPFRIEPEGLPSPKYVTWYRAVVNGTEYVDSCPVALAARMYRKAWKDLRPCRMGWEQQEQTPTPMSLADEKYLMRCRNHIREIFAICGEIYAPLYREWLVKHWSPNMQPVISNSGCPSVFPDVDGVGSWGRTVRTWEDGCG